MNLVSISYGIGYRRLTRQDRSNWTQFLVSLHVRSLENIVHIKNRGRTYLKESLENRPEEYKALSQPGDPSTLVAFTEHVSPGLIEDFGTINIPKFISDPKIGNMILHMKWSLVDFKGQKNHLLLSDCPCIFTCGINDSELLIALPIAPYKAFLLAKTEQRLNAMLNLDHSDLLMRMNETSLSQAQKRVYALDKSPHSFICNRMNKS